MRRVLGSCTYWALLSGMLPSSLQARRLPAFEPPQTSSACGPGRIGCIAMQRAPFRLAQSRHSCSLNPCPQVHQVACLDEFSLPVQKCTRPVISSRRRIPKPKTSVFSEDWPVERYSGAICPTVPRTAVSPRSSYSDSFPRAPVQYWLHCGITRIRYPCEENKESIHSTLLPLRREATLPLDISIREIALVDVPKTAFSQDVFAAEVVGCSLKLLELKPP
nr:hypothetical protein TEA_018319 [Ipomoea batatas]